MSRSMSDRGAAPESSTSITLRGLFRAGRDRAVILSAITNMHRPLEASKNIKQPATPVVKLVRSVLLKKGARCRYLVIDQPPDIHGVSLPSSCGRHA